MKLAMETLREKRSELETELDRLEKFKADPKLLDAAIAETEARIAECGKAITQLDPDVRHR